MAKASDYEAWRAGKAEKSRARSLLGRDIAEGYPPIANPQRRGRCRKSLKRFCETYNPEAFALSWCADHLKAIARIEEAALHGALYGFAMPRGSGKSTIVRMAALWAVSYGWRRYVFAIGANDRKGQDTLQAIKTFIRFLPDYAADFPEIAYPADRLGGLAQRAAGQLFGGQSTMIEWGGDRIVLPTIPPPANWPKGWPLRHDGMVPTSGSVVSASGLTGDGIRGSLLTLSTGEQVRPDLVLLDDPQTPESARSPAQNATREQLIAADVLGMAGPGKTIAAVMPCTVIVPGDMVDQLLDRKKHPLWRGERTRMLRSMPANLDAWERYREVYERCAQKEPPDFAEANAAYLANREALEAGAEAGWPERKLPGEVSAIQHAMHLYFRDKTAFFSEYQNDPLPLETPAPGELTPEQVSTRLNHHARSLAPGWASRLTAFVDVQQDLLFWLVCGWGDGFTGAVLDYGVWPDQGRAYFTLADARPTVSAATGIGSLEGSLWAALSRLTEEILDREWPHEGGGALRVERCLIDSGWSTELVLRFCRQSPCNAILTPSKGMGIGASANPMSEWRKEQGERRGPGWLLRLPKPGEPRVLLYDANAQKSFIHARLSQPLGEKGALTLFGDDPKAHRLLADHVCAEYRVRTEGRGRRLDEWKVRPHRPDNHLFDCLVGCVVAASFQGVALEGMQPQPQERWRVSYAELQTRARARR